MKHQVTKLRVKNFVEPSGTAVKNRQCPMNDGIALIKRRGQSGKVIGPRNNVHMRIIFEARDPVYVYFRFLP